jgi:hypothetical protein
VRIAIALALTSVALPALAGPAEEERAMALQLAQRDADAAPRDPMTPDALERAAFFRAALGQNRRAIRLVERWLRAGTHRREEIPQGKAWIARLRARPPPPAPKRLPERVDRRGVAGDVLVTAPLAP